MKKLIPLFLIVLFPVVAFAQNENPQEPVTDTVTFTSNPQDSLCNYIFRTGGCTSNSPIKNAVNENTTSNYAELPAATWTYVGAGCDTGFLRSLFNFNGLNTIPANAVITKAELKMYGWQNPTIAINYGNSYHTGSPYNSYGTNELVFTRITQPWNMNTVTWNNQPTTDTAFVLTGPSTSRYNDDIVVDVTKLVKGMVANNQFHGFMMRLQTEELYRCFGFHSFFAADSNKRPKLEVAYTIPASVEDVITDDKVALYPVPAQDLLTVEYLIRSATDISYFVYDTRGAKMLQGTVASTVGVNKIQLNVKDFPQGMYIISFTNGRSVVTKRFAKY